MARTLTIARAFVAPSRVAEYLAAARELTEHATRDGRHFWLFRHAAGAGQFVEFRESAGGWVPGAAPAEEQDAERRLRACAEYEPGGDVVWEEIRP